MLIQFFIFFISFSASQESKNYDLTDNSACIQKFDSLTKRSIYVDADVSPINEGGKAILIKTMQRSIDTDKAILEWDGKNWDSYIEIAFIIEKDGKISGERIVHDKTNYVGEDMLRIVKTFKWQAAICNKKKVAMLYSMHMIIDIAEG